MPFKIVEHTADIGIKITEKTLPQLFETAAYGMFSIFVENIDVIKPNKKFKIKITGVDPESLLVNWLNELLYLYSVKHTVFSKFDVILSKAKYPGTKFKLSATIFGEPVNPDKHQINVEIKSATYHNLHITRKINNNFSATIIFDI